MLATILHRAMSLFWRTHLTLCILNPYVHVNNKCCECFNPNTSEALLISLGKRFVSWPAKNQDCHQHFQNQILYRHLKLWL